MSLFTIGYACDKASSQGLSPCMSFSLLTFDVLTMITTLVVAILGATGKLRLPPAATYSLFWVNGVFLATYATAIFSDLCK